jgi:hypothetical protein
MNQNWPRLANSLPALVSMSKGHVEQPHGCDGINERFIRYAFHHNPSNQNALTVTPTAVNRTPASATRDNDYPTAQNEVMSDLCEKHVCAS